MIECQCEVCKSACENKPGWFMPGEVQVAAESLGMSVKEFFDRYLAVDYWMGDPTIYVLTLPTKNMKPGSMYEIMEPNGACTEFRDGKCSIHAVKPFECRYFDHTRSRGDNPHSTVAEAWNTTENQQMIADLVGHPLPKEISKLIRGLCDGIW